MMRLKLSVLTVLPVLLVLVMPLGNYPSGSVGESSLAWCAAPGPVLPPMVTPATVKAIDRGLEYLIKTQRANGSWVSGYSSYDYPVVMTSLAGLALLSSGSTPETGPYAKYIRKAMYYILRVAEASKDGLICTHASRFRSMYGHGFAMLFLAECYGMDLDEKTGKRIRKVLDKAVALTAKAQSSQGGWIYTPYQNSDEGSVTVTQLQALRACKNVGIKVPEKTITRAVEYLKKCQNPDGGICYSIRSRGSSRPPISAAAITCFYSAGVYDRQSGGMGKEAEMVEKLVNYCRHAARVGSASGHYYYMHFYMAQAWYHRGGKDWTDYYPKIRDHLLRLQNPDGSWMGDYVGTTYGTAIATFILQLPYGYLPICER